jgi:hypothetical protein
MSRLCPRGCCSPVRTSKFAAGDRVQKRRIAWQAAGRAEGAPIWQSAEIRSPRINVIISRSHAAVFNSMQSRAYTQSRLQLCSLSDKRNRIALRSALRTAAAPIQTLSHRWSGEGQSHRVEARRSSVLR